MTHAELLSAFQAHVAQTSLAPMGITVARARGCWLETVDGRHYLDLLAGIGVNALGHGHPRVHEAIARQAERHLHVMVYGELVQEAQVALATRLTGLLDARLDCVYFTNSGAEAVEGALKMARKATGRPGVVAFHGGFHGDTLGALSVGGNPYYRQPFEPLLPGVEFARFNDPAALAAIGPDTAAVIVEPVQAEAGVIPATTEFLSGLRERCDETGTLLILDEVLTGFGRTGHLFAHQGYGVVPDVLVLAKALGGGLPLGAFIASRALQRTLAVDPALGHVTTFGGHPLSCAAGLASLDVLVDEDLSRRAEAAGAQLAGSLGERLAGAHLREIRRAGALIGVELDRAETASALVHECRREGLILGWTLHDDRVVRLAPPLVIAETEIAEAVDRIERAFARVRPA